MAPRPEFSLMDQYNGIAQSIMSPTTVTNNIRGQPKSPRHPRAVSDATRGTAIQTTLSQSSSKIGSANRRRPLEELGKFAVGSSRTDGGKHPDVNMPHKMKPRIVGDLLTLSCSNEFSDDLSVQNTKQYTPRTTKNFGMCLDHTAAAAGDFVVTATEVYRLECKSDNQGGGGTTTFSDPAAEARSKFRNRSRSIKQNDKKINSFSKDNSLMESGSLSEEERRDYCEGNKGTNNKSSNYRRKQEPSGSPLRRTLNNKKMIALDEYATNISPPRVDRTTAANEFDPKAEHGNLMEARMELLKFGQDGVPQTDARLSRALQDLKRQDKIIDGWKRQLETAQQHLDETFAELTKTKKESQERQHMATEIRAKAVQERKKLQDMYEREMEQRKHLEEKVSKLQQEVSSLRVSLRNSHNSSSPRGVADSVNSNQVISLKAEIVELRSQLAETHAANIDDLSTSNSHGGIDELRRNLRAAEEQLSEWKTKELDWEKIQKEHENSIRSLNQKIERIESDAQKTQSTLEENLKAAIEEENQVRSELVKCKSNIHRLERERSRSRLHSAADVDRLTKQLSGAKDEVTKLQEELNEQKRIAQEESNKLKYEVSDLKQKLADLSKGLARKTATSFEEKTKMESELERLREEVTDLKVLLESKETEITSQANRIADLETNSKDRDLAILDSESASRQISELKEEVRALKENDVTLRAEISQHKALLAQNRTSDENAESLIKEKSKELDQLRSQVEELKLSNKKRTEDDEEIMKFRKEIVVLEKKVDFLQRKLKSQEDSDEKWKATERSLHGEINMLKSKLSESESKCTEERLRAEEERRISKENDARHAQELDEYRRENEKNGEDKLKLRNELEELRKQLANTGKSLSSSTSTEGGNTSSKVSKLRQELALARARLAAAREQTGTFAISHVSTSLRSTDKLEENSSVCTPEYTVQSSSESIVSTWAPPAMKSDESGELLPLDSESRHEESKNDNGTLLKSAVALSPRSTFSFGQKSLIDDDDDEGSTFFEPSSPKTTYQQRLDSIRSQKTRVDTNVEDLRRQLEESSKRLEKANTRLNGLVDLPALKKANHSFSPYRGINHETISTFTDDEKMGSSLEEVVTSESDSIEVHRVRYADV